MEEEYIYNEVNQLTQVQVKIKELPKEKAYEEDDILSRLKSMANESQKEKAEIHTLTYEYDLNGNMVKDNRGEYKYNAFDQMIEAKVADELGRVQIQKNKYRCKCRNFLDLPRLLYQNLLWHRLCLPV